MSLSSKLSSGVQLPLYAPTLTLTAAQKAQARSLLGLFPQTPSTFSLIGRGPSDVTISYESALALGGDAAILELVIGEVVTSIGANSLSGSDYLEAIKFGPNIVTIGAAAFNYTGSSGSGGLGTLELPESVVTVDISGFQESYFTGIDLGRFLYSQLETIGDQAFANCTQGSASFGDLIIPLGVTTIGDTAFENVLMDDVYTAVDYSSIYNSAFDSTGTANIYIAPAAFASWDGISTIGTKTVLEWLNYPNPIPN